MIQRERWEELRRLRAAGVGIAEIARQLELDRKTVRRWTHQASWQPYQRAARSDTLLAAHAEYLRTRAPEVEYSARILYQELRQQRGYTGSYETVKRNCSPRPVSTGVTSMSTLARDAGAATRCGVPRAV